MLVCDVRRVERLAEVRDALGRATFSRIARLRRKIEPRPQTLRTVRGAGYPLLREDRP